ncbi:acetate kinase [Sphingomonas sp. H39-1-10]|uniref:acetate/propionate family kinase n=1 Tax=Sphingomonas pollutisoli TaxID=3030829 RepID=UPI0023B953B3|nr:acetate kinase [Sphingomonas pollutisoli]MDF0487356.1 acetate kinase [Sphingomonas pollutisoli]
MGALILALNAGSSSLKYGAFTIDGNRCEAVAGGTVAGADHAEGFDAIAARLDGATPDAIGHRIVHGGPDLFDPVVVDADVTSRLEAACAFAPLHGPAALSLIGAARRRFPDIPQVACFDTGFHRDLPPVAAVLPVPARLRAEGIRRYGFHGLSCRSIVRQLGDDLPERLVIAHLGSGASVTAVRAGRSVDTSMGLTPSGGVVMATRSGDIDPGVLLFLLRERGMTAATLEELVDKKSGLLGVSDRSGDMRTLREAREAAPEARLAIDIFCRSVAKQIAAMIVSLGGIDMLVFSGGIGEHDAATRDAICADLAWAGVPRAGEAGAVGVRVCAPDEEEQIARETAALVGHGATVRADA